MKEPTWAGVRAIVLAATALFLLPLQAQAERNWEFSVGAFGGKALHSSESVKISQGSVFDAAGMVIGSYTDATANGVNLNDAPTFGGRLTAWNLPRQYKWQPQIGLELDWTRFTADLHPQTVGATGTVNLPGFELGSITFSDPSTSASTYWPPIFCSATQSERRQKCRKDVGIHTWEEVSVLNVRP